jgi:hypothetical protein
MLSSVIPPGPSQQAYYERVVSNSLPVRPQLRTNIRTNTLERSRPFISQHGPPNIVRVARFSHLWTLGHGARPHCFGRYHPCQIRLC